MDSKHVEHSPFVVIANEDENYGGNIIELKSSSAPQSFLVIKQGDDKVFELTGQGSIETAGGASFLGEQGLYVRNHTTLSGGLSISKAEVLAGPTIKVPGGIAYVKVLDDSSYEANELIIEGHRIGQVLVVTNDDEQPLICKNTDVEVPRGGTILLLFDGVEWHSLDALNSAAKDLTDISQLTATRDINIGNHTLGAGRLQSSELEAGRVVVTGNEGVFGLPKLRLF